MKLARASFRLLFALLASLPAAAFESRLLDADGEPVAGAQVSIAGRSGSWRTAPDGRFRIEPDPQLPATLIVVGSRGELYPPIAIERLLPELRIEPAFRESVTVTLGAAPNIEGTPAAAPVIIGTEELEQRKPSHVAEAIAATPGVALRGEGAPAVPVVRGLAGGRTLLLIDDARIVAERRAGPSATFVDPLSLGSIEVSRGPGSVAYGSDALGGVVHLRPRDPIAGDGMVRYDFSASFGGTPMQSAAVEVTSDAFGGSLLAAMHARSASDGEDGDGGTIANSGYRNRGAMLRFVRPTDWGRIRTGLFTSIGREVGAPSSDSSRTWYPDERATLATFAADVDSPGAWSALSFRGAVGAYSITTSRDRGTSIESSAVKARDASLRASAERAIGNARLITGADVVGRFNLRASGSIEDADRWNAGAWASWETPLTASARVAAGGRVDHITSSNHGGWFGDRSRRDTALSGFAAITVAPAPRLTTTVQLASGYREPVLSDRYYRGVSGRGFIIGNPDLEPERSLQFDAAARWTGSRSRAALFVYEYRIRDLVERYRSGTDFHFRNRGEARIRGIELELSTKLARDLELLGGASLARGEDRDSGDALDDIGGPVLHASLRWAGPNASAFATASAWARDERPGPVETVRPGSATIDVGAGWRFTPEFEVRLVVRNATDRWYYGSPDAAASFAPGRSVTIGINR